MPTRHGGSLAKNANTSLRLSLRATTTLPSASTPWTWNTFFARSSPMVVIVVMDGSSLVIRHQRSLYGTSMPSEAPSTSLRTGSCTAASVVGGFPSDHSTVRYIRAAVYWAHHMAPHRLDFTTSAKGPSKNSFVSSGSTCGNCHGIGTLIDASTSSLSSATSEGERMM